VAYKFKLPWKVLICFNVLLDQVEEFKKEEVSKEEAKPEETITKVFGIDEYYPPGHREKVIIDPSLPNQISQFQY